MIIPGVLVSFPVTNILHKYTLTSTNYLVKTMILEKQIDI